MQAISTESTIILFYFFNHYYFIIDLNGPILHVWYFLGFSLPICQRNNYIHLVEIMAKMVLNKRKVTLFSRLFSLAFLAGILKISHPREQKEVQPCFCFIIFLQRQIAETRAHICQRKEYYMQRDKREPNKNKHTLWHFGSQSK